MEKLLKLINEYHYNSSEVCKYLYDDEAKKVYFRTVLDDWDADEERIDDERIISKRFGFIKWLVDNDKIDQTVIDWNFWYFCMEWFDTVDSLLMVLAIQDEPIEFLISILK